MITRFEKRVVAVILAVILAIPLSGLPSVAVQAEEAENITDAPQPEQPDVAEEQQEGGETEQTEEGAFIPIIEEEEPVEAEGDGTPQEESPDPQEPEMPAAQPEPSLEPAEKSPNAELPDEQMEELTVQADGTPTRVSTVVEEAGMPVRYRLIPEVSETYYIDLYEYSRVTIYEKTEYGETYVASGMGGYRSSCGAELTAGTTYYIDISCYSQTWEPAVGTVNWTVSICKEIGLGNHTARISQGGDTVHYHLTGAEAGVYFFKVEDNPMNTVVNIQVGYNGYSTSSSQYLMLDGTQEYHISAYSYDTAWTGDIAWSVEKAVLQDLAAGETIHSSFVEGEKSMVYVFRPEESGNYKMIGSDRTCAYAHTYDSSWNRAPGISLDSGGVVLEKGQTYYVCFDAYNSGEVDWRIELQREVIVEEGQEYVADQNEPAYYKFIPAESGRYKIVPAGDDSVNSSVYDHNMVSVFEQGEGYTLSGGEEYYLNVFSYEAKAVSWKIEKIQQVEVQLGELYRSEANTAVEYKFIPQETGEYLAEGMYIYNSDWWCISLGSWSPVQLEAGETYYLSSSVNRYWSIDKAEPAPEKERITVEEGQTYTFNTGEPVVYLFSPEESARYHFMSDQRVNVCIDGTIKIGGTDDGLDGRTFLEKGKEYEISIEPVQSPETVTWSMKKSILQSVKESVSYTSSAGEEIEYEFTPEESGTYILSSEDNMECDFYDTSWNKMSPYEIESDTGFVTSICLEAGETCYIEIRPEETARWKLDGTETSGEYGYRILENGKAEILRYTGNEGEVEIPEEIDGKEVSSIGYGAFAGNSQIESVTIPGKVTSLQYGAFLSCSNLKRVAFAEGTSLQTIGYMAFKDCRNLAQFSLPDNIRAIGEQSFRNCTKLDLGQMGSSLETIGDGAFQNTGLTSLCIPDSVTEVGKTAFYECTLLNNVTLGKGIDGISDGMFGNCEELGQIKIPENITYIGESAFSNTGLRSVDIPESVTSIGGGAFASCAELQEATVRGELTRIENSAFSNTALKEFAVGDTVREIGEWAFARNEDLTSVTMPNSVTKIEYGAFYSSANLQEIVLPDSLRVIEGMAFDGCQSLDEIQIPDSVEKIGERAFASTGWYADQPQGPVYAGKFLYKYKGDMPEQTVLEIADGTKGIVGGALYWQDGLTEVQIPDTVKYIGASAFVGCENLREVHVPGSVTEIEKNAMGYLDDTGLKVTDFTIYGLTGSAAETYAEENGFAFVSEGVAYIRGDVNEDGIAGGIDDLRVILRYVCKKVELTDSQKKAGDVTDDGEVGIEDLRKVLRFVCKKIEAL